MDEKKEQAILKATKNLISTKTPESEVIISLKELGLTEKEAKKIITKAKSNSEKTSSVSIIKKEKINETEKKELKQEPSVDSGEVEEIIKGAKESKNEETSTNPDFFLNVDKKDITEDSEKEQVEKKEEGLSFFSRILPKKKTAHSIQNKPNTKNKKTFIPVLKKGGKVKVKEIIFISPLEKTNLTQKEKEQQILKKTGLNNLEKLPKKENTDKSTNNFESLEKMLENNSSKSSSKINSSKVKNKSNFPSKGTSTIENKSKPIVSTLDAIEKKVEKGAKLEQAMEEITQQPKTKISCVVSIIIIPNREYSNGMATLINNTNSKYKKIIYVNLNELYATLMQRVESNGADIKKFFFVDAITLTSDKNAIKKENCIYVNSPNSLIELSLGITQAINTQEPDALIFDSLSTLLIYENESTVTKFVHSLIGKIKAHNIDAYFTAIEGDSKSEAIKDLSMFVDKVNTLTEFELGEMGFSTQHSALAKNLAKKEINVPSRSERLAKFETTEPPQNRIVQKEMGILKDRLQELQLNQQMTKSLTDLTGKMGNVKELNNIKNQVEKISEKINEKKEIPVNKTILNQITKLEKKIDGVNKNKPKEENKKENKEITNALKNLMQKVDKIEKLSTLQTQVKQLSKKIENKKQKKVDSTLINQITNLEKKIGSLEQKLSKKERKNKESSEEKLNLKGKLGLFKKQLELESMMNELYATDVSKIDPKKIPTVQFEKKITRKKDILEKAYKKGFVSKSYYSKNNRRIKQEGKRLKHAVEVHSLEQKLNALVEAYDSGVISKESFVKGKTRIERLLKN